MLHHSGTVLELISDVDMLLFLESGIRGGVSYAGLRYSEKDVHQDCNTDFLYLDANNLVSNPIPSSIT